ncbi:MAG: efflux RND transporter permease subunit, partial [Bacteroidota bacterium]
GVAILRVEASYDIEDFDEKYDELIAEVNTTRDELPDEIALLEFEHVSPLGTNILQLAITSDESAYKQLIKIGEDLEDELNKVNGVRSVDVEAYPEEEIRISLDFQKMANQNISLPQVIGILRGYNANIPGGDINADTRSFTIQTSGGYKTLDEIRNTVISSNQGQLLYLNDIAKVNFDYEDDRFIARYEKQKCNYVTLTQKEGINIIALAEKLNAVIAQFKTELPEGVRLYTVFEQAPAVSKRINEFFQNLIQGVALVGAIILLFLGFRSALIVMTVIPTSIIMAIGTLDLNSYGLQQISIAGLVIALGLLVDNGIVVVENINRFLKEGYGLKEAAYKGTSEVGWAIVSSTVTTLLSFFPLTMLNTGAGSFLRSLPLIVIYALVSSLMLALTFTPLLASIFLKEKPVDTGKKPKDGLVARLLKFLVSKLYRPALNFSLRFPLVVIIFSIAGLVGSFALFPLVGVS